MPQTAWVPRDLLERGVAAVELFNRTGLAASNSEARRLIRGGGARINDTAVDDETRIVRLADIGPQGVLKLSAGRKRHIFVRRLPGVPGHAVLGDTRRPREEIG